MIDARIESLREEMEKYDIQAYLVPSSDPHQSEYIADHYASREYITGFTGSAGTALITRDKAGLWTDGRYFVQAEEELAGCQVDLYKMGQTNCPSMKEFLRAELEPGQKLGFCGESLSYQTYLRLEKELEGIGLVYDLDLVGNIWENRPALPTSKIFIHNEKYTGQSARQRIERLRAAMKEKGLDYYLITALDEVCYLYTIRASDVPYNPVAISYGLVSQEKAYLFIDFAKVEADNWQRLEDEGISIREYEAIYQYLKNINEDKTIFFDPSTANLALVSQIAEGVDVVMESSYIEGYKAIKNETELAHQTKAYIKDGAALVKFFSWLETGITTGLLSEGQAADRLLEFRKEGDLFLEPSFETISAYGPNAALPHYSPGVKGDIIQSKGLYLCDSGGQYLDGTTDITRTIAVGELTDEEIYHYTIVLKSHIALVTAQFKEGTTGYYLDAFARYPLLKEHLDFNHGTGHGVGYFLNVHEGPHSISSRYNGVALEPGMVVSIEPGLYIEGSHGVRIENIVAVKEAGANEFGKFLAFDILSYVPIDTRPVDLSLLTDEEISWLNDYNQASYDKLSPLLRAEDDLAYLSEATRAVAR